MSNTDRDSMLERWANGMEKLEQYYEDLYGPPTTPATLPSVTDCDGMLGAIADGLERARININKHSNTYHDTKTAYVKTVPANTKVASIEKVGGKTIVWNQVCWFTSSSTGGEKSGITYNVSQDGTVVMNGTATANADYIPYLVDSLTVGHIYWLRGCTPDSSNTTYYLATNNGNCYADGLRFTANGSTTKAIHCMVKSGVVANNVTFKVQITDLTVAFGAGNEPTLAECKEMFPTFSYPYNAGELLSAGVTDVVSKDNNSDTLHAYSVPAAVQSLDGYGLSVGSVYNYVDFERKVFVKKVGVVDLSTLTFGYGPSVGWSATLPNVKDPVDDNTAFNGLSATLTVTDRTTQAAAFSGGTDAGMVSVAGGKVYVGTGDISIVPSGTLIYELDTLVETDISAYVTDDTRIEVESDGTLTFPNNNGDNYRILVPSTETFWVEI